jgi:hypothetical protein
LLLADITFQKFSLLFFSGLNIVKQSKFSSIRVESRMFLFG